MTNNIFDEREKGFEAKYKLDQEIAFKVGARRARLIGQWLATRAGMDGEATAEYARAGVELALDCPNDTALVACLHEKHPDIGEKSLQQRLNQYRLQARAEVIAEIEQGTRSPSEPSR
ncbi:MAG: DUF1476 family protein [Alphaproteobacteria bacterium]|nr:DUF1476 family protein [Alphaproteobacteria bacterium]